GPRQPEPFFDKFTKIYLVALKPDLRSPFEPPDELHPPEKDKDKNDEKKSHEPAGKDDLPAGKEAHGDKKEVADSKTSGLSTNRPVEVEIDLAGLSGRLWEVPVPPGNYSDLALNDKRLFWVTHDTSAEAKAHLQVLDIGNEEP